MRLDSHFEQEWEPWSAWAYSLYEARSMQLEITSANADKTQRTYARLAGCLFLGVIILAFGSGFILSHIAGSGTFPETARRIAASERLYRTALSTAVIATLGSVLLAFALYA